MQQAAAVLAGHCFRDTPVFAADESLIITARSGEHFTNVVASSLT